jgi:hypothetical protein
MLLNGAEELRGQMGKARSTLARARLAEPSLEGSAPANFDGTREAARLASVPP